MSKDPRLSKRESSATLRRETLAPSSGRKRSGSNGSTTSRTSMFTSPAKGFGLVRKASTATLSVAPVSVTGGGLDHTVEGTPNGPGGSVGKGKGTDKPRPVRQSTKAEDALRFVQTRAPAASTTVSESDLPPLSESPKNDSAPLPPISDDATPSRSTSTMSTNVSKSRLRTSLIPIFRGSPERTKSTVTAATAANVPASASTPPRQATSNFRTPSMTPSFGITRKASTSSIRSTATGYKPVSSSPLAGTTPATTAPAPLSNSSPVPPKLDTGSAPAKPIPTGTSPIVENPISSSPSGASWLSAIRGITSSKSAVPGSDIGDSIRVSPQPAADFVSSPVDKDSAPVDKKAAGLEVAPVLTRIDQAEGEHSPGGSESGLVLVDAPASPIDANTYQINSLAAQHASSWMTNTPAGWLAWMTSGPGVATLPTQGRIDQGDGESEVMHIESDEEEAEVHGQTPAMGSEAVAGNHEGQKAGWGWAVKRLSGEARASTDLAEGDKKQKRPSIDTGALSMVPAPAESEGAVPSASTIASVAQNALNSTALRYALQLPLLGRSKHQPSGSQGAIGEWAAEGQPLSPAANPSGPRMIVTRYSDEHDFVIIETEVDGWILIDTDGMSPTSPLTPARASLAGRLGAGGSSWWNYYTGRAEMAEGTPSDNSSMFTTVLRPFGLTNVPTEGSGTTAVDAAQESAKPPKTQAELIKEEALARQSPSIVPGLPSPVLNTTTKSSWVSYFSSKASRSTPVMSDGRALADHAGEMEVMNIDEDEMSEPIEVQTSNPIRKAKPASPRTDSPSIKHKASVISQDKKSSASSARSTKVSLPNLVLPTFGDTFYTLPRCVPPRARAPAANPGSWKLPMKRTVKNLSTMLFNTSTLDKGPNMVNAEMEEYQRQAAERRRLTNRANFAIVEPAAPRTRPGSNSSFGSLAIDDFGQQLPRVFSVLGNGNALGDTSPIRAAVIGVHGWFPGPLVRSVFGEPTGTSVKFATMGVDALRQFAEKHGVELESVTPMPLEGEGTIERRVTKLYDDLLKHPKWLADLHRADVVLVATHSQGSIVSTHLIARLISDGHIRTRSNRLAVNRATEQTQVVPPVAPHRVCCLAMCGIHMGPLYSLNSSALAQPYLQWFESQAARELFEFQNTESEVSRNYVAALSTALDHGTKFVYIASLNDQVVPIYSGAFVAASHPLILRGLFLDGDAYSSSDFLSNLLVLLLRVKNAGLDEHGLVVHLSEATAGSLSGIGHSTTYEDLGSYNLAVRYLFETSDVADDVTLSVDAFEARASRNDYEIPWLLHSVMSDARISRIFAPELAQLRESFGEWKPTTAVLRDIQRKLAPIRMSPLRHSLISQDSKL